jgi:hypothetical protein
MVAKTGRSLIWIQGNADPGWACSSCQWRFPLPTLLAAREARDAYDRLAAAKFREHICEAQIAKPAVARDTGPTFADRARKLIKAGYKPKDAVELVSQEIVLEHRDDAAAIEQARTDAEDFLLKLRKGLI